MNGCRFCGNTTTKKKIGCGPATKPEWGRWHCNGCGSFGYIDNPGVDDLGRIYETAWQDTDRSGAFAAGSTDLKIARSLLDAINFDTSQSHCLDYGGGRGVLAQALVDRGCKSLTVFEPFGQNPGLPESVSWVNDLALIQQQKYDLILMVEVLEHLLDPVDELKKIRELLSPGGKLVITTPNARGWRARIDGFKWREVQNPTHINLFSSRSLQAVLREAGYMFTKRVQRPVTYRAKGLKAVALTITQILGVDGGLRFIAATDGEGC